MAVSGPSADRRGIQKPYAIGHACGSGIILSSGGGTAQPSVVKISHKGLANIHQIDWCGVANRGRVA
jgi:hypothetical protein